MFEDKTYDALLQEVINNAPSDIDTRQGSIFYDAVSGTVLKIAKLYTDIDLIHDMCSVANATGDALDTKASEHGITRHPASAAKYYFTYKGTTPEIGSRFYNDERYFTLQYDDDGGFYYLEAEEAGEDGNDVYSGTAAIPVNEVEGMTDAFFGEIYEHGTDEESDESLRTRVQEKIAGPAENGNIQDYKTWCESIDGIGRAKIYPLWNGPNTVKAVLINQSGRACTDAKVAEVQEYVDPATKGYTATVDGVTYVVGDGIGAGKANIGAHFTASSAMELSIDVSFTAYLADGYTTSTAKEQVEEAVADYLKELSLDAESAEDNESKKIVIRLSEIGSLIINLDSITDYEDLALNGATKNIVPGDDEIPVAGEVTIQ